MAFDLHIKNIGKLTDAKLRIGQFTVLAGPNNTGKSFVSKILYSLFDAMNANHPEVHLREFTDPIRNELEYLDIRGRDSAAHGDEESPESPINTLNGKIRGMEDLVAQRSWNNFTDLQNIINTLNDMTVEFPNLLSEIHKLLKQPTRRRRTRRWQEDDFEDLEKSVKILQEQLALMKPYHFITGGISRMLSSNFTANFQSNIFALRDKKDREAQISIPGIGSLRVDDQSVESSIEQDGVRLAQKYSKVLYLESPMHWKLKNALEALRLSDRHRRTRRERLSGVPEYFYDLASELRSEYTEDMDFPELHAKLTGKNVLGGKLVISPDTGEILFRENDRSFRLVLTATGVINLGILALLIERKILDKNSFVFVDEPEAHLHPAWQVVMAESLFELVKGGAHVVIATHSADILKWLEVHIKKNPEDVDLVALNKFPPDAAIFDEESFEDKMAAIKQELTKPFADLYMEGL